MGMGMLPVLAREPVVEEEGAVQVAEGDEGEKSRVAVLERIVAQLGKRVGDLERYTKLQTCSLEELFSICYSLQDSTEKVRYNALNPVSRRLTNGIKQLITPAANAQVRRRMDDSRYHLVQGLITVLPNEFDIDALMCDFDRTGDFHNWSAFTDQVNIVFNTCHSWERFNRKWYKYQRYPILSRCYPDQLLETVGVEPPYIPVICPGLLSTKPVFLAMNAASVIDKLTADDVALRSVRFLLPALVWGYNELKKVLLHDEMQRSQAAFDLELQQLAAMANPDHAVVPVRREFADIADQFKTGTGQPARNHPYWRNKLQHAKELEELSRQQMEYAMERNAWSQNWVAGRTGMPVRPEAGQGGPVVIQGTTVYVGAGGQVAGHVVHGHGHSGAPPVFAPHQQVQHEGNGLINWHMSRRNPRGPPLHELEQRHADMERMRVSTADAVAHGALPHVAFPEPTDPAQREEDSNKGM